MSHASFWPQLGEYSTAIALGLALFAGIASFWGKQRGQEKLIKSSEYALHLTTGFVSLATLILVGNFLTDNFLVRYVYGYSNQAMPTIYKFTALWGGQDGSLLFWLWIASVFASAAIFFHRKSDRDLIPYIITVFGVILAFFSCLILYSDNPFELFPKAPADGRGLNPLLQNPSMAIHPPTLYLGFVGMSVPFAFAISSLMSNQLGIRWIIACRVWTLTAWFFLSIGNLLGAQWAYTELGWGGFWGWDPVENAALLPWLTASAFLHSVMIQEKRGLLKFWNVNLVVLTFALTLLGTYLTRSGVVQSVHSFAESAIGYFFLIFLGIVLLVSGFLIWLRRKELKSPSVFESFLSKESAFVLNNIVLVGAAFIILWSTLFPSASELIIGTRIIVGPPFFNAMLAPLGIVLLVLTGVGPVVAWRKSTKKNLKSNFTFPTILGSITALCMFLLGVTQWYVVATGFGVAFVLATIVMEFYRGARARVVSHREHWPQAILQAIFRNNRKYGGYIVHLGMVFIFVGFAGAAYKEVFEFDMQPGQSETFNNYQIHFKDLVSRDTPNQAETYAVIDLYHRGQFLSTVKPARFFYKNPEQPSTEVDIHTRLKEDVYFTLGSMNPQTGFANIRVTLNPMISWLWIGGLVLIIGGLIAMLPPMNFSKRSARPS